MDSVALTAGLSAGTSGAGATARRAEAFAGWRLAGPAVALLTLLILLPTIGVLALSLTDFELGYDGIRFVGLDNYLELLEDRTFLISLGNTLIYTLIVTPLSVLLGLGAAFAGLAALVHLGIFLLESALWSRPAVHRLFGVRRAEDAALIRPMAYNQGFYNLFLAIGAVAGLVLGAGPLREGGTVLTLFALLCMLFAAVVLLASRPALARAALVQGGPPLLGLVFLVLALPG